MAVLIGHASIDERGKVAGGNAGDQSGKEVCTRSWYAHSWAYVLRCKNEKIANTMAISCERACANPNIGYDQNQRNTLRTQAQKCGYDLSKITTPCECDCSSLMAVCAECAGVPIPYSGMNAPTTSTMKNAFLATGFFEVLTDSKYLTSANYLKRGDILVRPGSHTIMVLENGTSATATVPKTTTPSYIVGSVYTLGTNLYVRDLPFGEKVKFSCITANAQQNAKFDSYGNAILKEGTRVTCKAVRKETNSTWILIPSGWVCAIEAGKVYIS